VESRGARCSGGSMMPRPYGVGEWGAGEKSPLPHGIRAAGVAKQPGHGNPSPTRAARRTSPEGEVWTGGPGLWTSARSMANELRRVGHRRNAAAGGYATVGQLRRRESSSSASTGTGLEPETRRQFLTSTRPCGVAPEAENYTGVAARRRQKNKTENEEPPPIVTLFTQF